MVIPKSLIQPPRTGTLSMELACIWFQVGTAMKVIGLNGEAGICAVSHVELEHRPEPDHARRGAELVLVRNLKVKIVPTSPNVSFTCQAFKFISYSGPRVFLNIPEEHTMSSTNDYVATGLAVPMHFRLYFEDKIIHLNYILRNILTNR